MHACRRLVEQTCFQRTSLWMIRSYKRAEKSGGIWIFEIMIWHRFQRNHIDSHKDVSWKSMSRFDIPPALTLCRVVGYHGRIIRTELRLSTSLQNPARAETQFGCWFTVEFYWWNSSMVEKLIFRWSIWSERCVIAKIRSKKAFQARI